MMTMEKIERRMDLYAIAGSIDGQHEQRGVDRHILQHGHVVEPLQELQQRRKGRAAFHRQRRQRVPILVVHLERLFQKENPPFQVVRR